MRVYIKQNMVETILKISEKVYPKEFIGLLDGKIDSKNDHKQTLVDINKLIIPSGSIPGRGFASYQIYRTPYRSIGTVHSHPSNSTPSPQDLNIFLQNGIVHIIVSPPYTFSDINVYDKHGNKIEDVEFYGDDLNEWK